MGIIEELNKDKILMKNNVLIKARYNLSLIENRIFLYLLYKLQKQNETTLFCDISHKEFKEIIKFKSKNTLNGITDALSELRSKPVYFKKKNTKGDGNIWGEYGFINGFEYDDKLGTFRIEASSKVYELLKEYLKAGYTPINVKTWISLNNSYAQRFYDLLRLWSNSKNIITYEIDELKELLMLENKYKKYNDFKKRVIDQSVKELNDKGNFKINFQENKIGKKVNSISFIVEDLDERVYFDNKNIVELKQTEYLTDKVDSNKFNEFYIPNKKLFTSKTLDNFTKDFNNIDFKESKYKKVLQESIIATLDKDDSEKIYVKSYNYFKKTLENKLKDLSIKENKTEFKKTKFHNFDETFTKYSEDEFEDIILESQKKKFG